MYLSVQLAARRLGVSAHTVRRWTASGFLPCARTPGGHRRIRQEDIDELAQTLGGSNHLEARRARERELDTLMRISIAVSSQLDMKNLLAEIAKSVTGLLDVDFCTISHYDRENELLVVLADYDAKGHQLPDEPPLNILDYPFTRLLLHRADAAWVNVNDPRADAAEASYLRRTGLKCELLLPLVYQGSAIGLLEAYDQRRERKYTRQELRLSRAVAAQAAVALHNATLFADLVQADSRIDRLLVALAHAADGASATSPEQLVPVLLKLTATVACDALGAVSCVAAFAGESAGVTGALAGAPIAVAADDAGSKGGAQVVSVAVPCGSSEISLTATLPVAAADGPTQVLELIAAAAALHLQVDGAV